jgi:hypothetical protein
MKDLIEIKLIYIKNNKFGLVVLNDKEFSNPYRIAIYSTGLDYYEYYEQKSSHGLKTILFPLKSSNIYTIAVHDLHHKLLVLKYYKETCGETDSSQERIEEEDERIEKEDERIEEEDERIEEEEDEEEEDERIEEEDEIILEIKKHG